MVLNTRIDDLVPEMQTKVRTFLSLLKVPYVVTSTRRTTDEQVALFSQGRAPLPIVNLLRLRANLYSITEGDNVRTVTNCDGINTLSNHQSGKAIDVVPADVNGKPIWPHPADPRWGQIAQFGKAAGLLWGGDWKDFPDLPHYFID